MAYMSYYVAGTRVVDLTDPNNPVEVGYYRTSTMEGGYNGNWGVYPYRDDGVIYSSDRQNGLFITQFTGGFAGEIQGIVRNATTSAPLDSAHVDMQGERVFNTDGSGSYGGFISGETYQVVTTRFGYAPDTSVVTVPENGVVTHNVDLTPLPNGAVQLTLLESGSLAPVAGAKVAVLETPIVGLTTNGSGQVTITGLPIALPWTVRVGKFGRALTDIVVVSSPGTTTELTRELLPGFSDDFDHDQAWTPGAPGDNATDGRWERAIPIGSYEFGIVGPSMDASPIGAGYAYVTENHVEGAYVATSDVDNGRTTLLSPVFNAVGFGDLTLTYQRWFANNMPVQSDDEFRADVSTDGGATWTNLETLDFGTNLWVEVMIDLSAAVTPTSQMRLRFVAEDLGADTHVEAGIDDVAILSSATDAPGEIAAEGPRRLALSKASPNPFRESTTLALKIPNAGPAALDLFDVSGRRITTLLSGDRLAEGTYRLRWDGRDASGNLVGAGVYFAVLRTAEGSVTEKVMHLR
jgi:hypothetical protein